MNDSKPASASVPDGVIQSSDGTLFLAGGRHEVMRLMKGDVTPSEKSSRVFAANVVSRSAFCESKGIDFHAYVFPDKVFVLRHLLDDGDAIDSVYKRHYASSEGWPDGLPCTYLDAPLERSRAAFPRTDTHYSPSANLECVIDILGQRFPGSVGAFRAHFQAGKVDRPGFSGDLGRKFQPPRTEALTVYRPRVVAKQESNGMASGNDGLLIISTNPHAVSTQRLLLFADSYFRALLPFLGFFFRETVFCRTRFFHPEVVRATRPDMVLTGMAERYLSSCIPDARAPHFLAYPLLKGRSLDPSPGFAEAFDSTFDAGKVF